MLRNLFRRNVTDDSHSEVNFDDDFYDQFWRNFRKHLSKEDSSLTPFTKLYDVQKSTRNNNIYTYSGYNFGWFNNRSLWLLGWTDVTNDRISAKLRLKNVEEMSSLFEQLKEDQESIHTHFGGNLEWDDPPQYSVGVYRSSVEFGNTSNHEELFEWLHENLEKLERVFMWKLASYFVDGYTQ